LSQDEYALFRKTFPEPKTELTEDLSAVSALGCEAFVLPMPLRVEALTCWQRLRPLNSTLTQAVEFFIKNRPRPEAAKSLEELKHEFLKSRKTMNCRPRTLVQYESYLRVICGEFGKTDIARILREDIEDWLEESDWSPRTRKNYLVTFTTVLNYAVGKGYRLDNPAAGLERPILDDRPVGSPKEDHRDEDDECSAGDRRLVPGQRMIAPLHGQLPERVSVSRPWQRR